MKYFLLPFVAGMLLTSMTVNAGSTGTIALADTWTGPYCSKFTVGGVGGVTYALRAADFLSNPNATAMWQTVLRVADSGRSVTVSEPSDIIGPTLPRVVFCNVEQTEVFLNPALIEILPK
jgi:hypothetical protein